MYLFLSAGMRSGVCDKPGLTVSPLPEPKMIDVSFTRLSLASPTVWCIQAVFFHSILNCATKLHFPPSGQLSVAFGFFLVQGEICVGPLLSEYNS